MAMQQNGTNLLRVRDTLATMFVHFLECVCNIGTISFSRACLESCCKILICCVLGNNYYAYCNFPINLNDDRCQFAAVAIEDGTEVFFDLASGVTIEPLDGVTYSGPVSIF